MAITASEARKNLFPLIEQVNADRAPVEITSKNGRAILMSADDWEAWQETAYLFRSPANARRLLDAADALDKGRGVRPELDASGEYRFRAAGGWDDYVHWQTADRTLLKRLTGLSRTHADLRMRESANLSH